MSEDEAVERLAEIAQRASGDPEVAHVDADAVLMAFVPARVRDAYTDVMLRCPWWAFA